MVLKPDYRHAAQPATHLAVVARSQRQTWRSSCLSPVNWLSRKAAPFSRKCALESWLTAPEVSCWLSVFSNFNKSQTHKRTRQGRIAKTRAGKPEPALGLGKLMTRIRPNSGH